MLLVVCDGYEIESVWEIAFEQPPTFIEAAPQFINAGEAEWCVKLFCAKCRFFYSK